MFEKENIDCVIKELKELQSLADALAVCNPVPPSLLQLIKDKALRIAAGADQALIISEDKTAGQNKRTPVGGDVIQKDERIPPSHIPLQSNLVKSEFIGEINPEKKDFQLPETKSDEEGLKKDSVTQIVVDLTKSMTLNERFRFQRNLFAGNEALMYITLEDLGRFSNLKEMRQYLATHFQWDWESEPVLDFLQFLEKSIN